MPSLTLKPTHKAISAYYDSLAKFAKLGVKHETAVRSAFQELLEYCARQFDWKLVPELVCRLLGMQRRLNTFPGLCFSIELSTTTSKSKV